jgi:hypothetical protein
VPRRGVWDANGLLAGRLSGIIGACFASPDPERNMVEMTLTIAVDRFCATLDY